MHVFAVEEVIPVSMRITNLFYPEAVIDDPFHRGEIIDAFKQKVCM